MARTLVTGALALTHSLSAADAGPSSSVAPISPKLAFANESISMWTKSMELGGGFGYKDNVTLSAVKPESSTFWRSNAEIFLYRLPSDGLEATAVVDAEDIRYLESRTSRLEDFVTARAQVRRFYESGWIPSFAATYSYMDQIWDASVSEAALTTVRARGHLVQLEPEVQRWLVGKFHFDVQFLAQRQYLNAPLDDYWEYGPKFSIGLRYKNQDPSEVGLSVQVHQRTYDTRQATDGVGATLSDTHLSFDIYRYQANWDHAFGEHQRLRLTTKVGVELNQDSAAGYFDYKRYFAGEQIRVKLGSWKFSANGEFSEYEFGLQPVSTTDTRMRRNSILSISGRIERPIRGGLVGYAQGGFEQSLSNRDTDRYHAATVSAGVEFGF